MKIGIDLGVVKTEAVALHHCGFELIRHRLRTPKDDYNSTLQAMASPVSQIERDIGETGMVGIGIPGCISKLTGLAKLFNCTPINGCPIDQDLAKLLERQVRVANDANYQSVITRLSRYAFGKEVSTPILKAMHGDSSGVRGAAWLWLK